MTLSLRTEIASPQRATMHLQGRLDALTFIDFDDAIDIVLPRVVDGGTMVLDLSALEYISSAGLRSIAKIRKSMRARHGHTLLLNPQPQVRKVFDIVKAIPLSEVFTSTQELDAYLDQVQRQIVDRTREDDRNGG